ncbi:hypothetical protein LEP1GSC052_2073 [Leptospira kmetyi serovar Malaysia str. Bejo-Iso9]|nr:hypothetical protein LEP1GSC052_2073 [Leptospira kmetyi serovar Malaysia str. Bejo-Iso9]
MLERSFSFQEIILFHISRRSFRSYKSVGIRKFRLKRIYEIFFRFMNVMRFLFVKPGSIFLRFLDSKTEMSKAARSSR